MTYLQISKDRGGLIEEIDFEELEKTAAALAGVKRCVLLESASAGLALTLGSCGIGDGDSVFCSPLAGAHVGKALKTLGATPICVDINPNTLNIDPYCLDYILRKIKRDKTPPPKALIATDQFGLPCNYEVLESMCAGIGIELIEDMESGFGGRHAHRMSGGFGRFAVASILSGESGSDGAVFCRNKADSQLIRTLQGNKDVRRVLHGQLRLEPGGGLVQGALLEQRLEAIPAAISERQKIAGLYRNRLEGCVRFQEAGSCVSAYTRFAIVLWDEGEKEAVMEAFLRERIPWTNLAEWPSESGKALLINAEQISKRLLLLPMHQYLTANVVNYICDVLIDAISSEH